MNFYQFFTNDLRSPAWLIFKQQKEPPHRIQAKSQYTDLCCAECHRFDHDTVFAMGFDADFSVRTKWDSFCSGEGFLCFRSRLVEFLVGCGVTGLAFKKIPKSDFFVISVTERVPADRNAYVLSRPFCRTCGRRKGVTGLIEFRRRIELPDVGRKFVAPLFSREGSWNLHRDVFASEDIVFAMRAAGFKGGQFWRLLNSEEEEDFKAAVGKNEIYNRPAGAAINL
jgi:hypothetical protein